MTKDKLPNKPPTFLTAITTLLLGVVITIFGTFTTIFINYFAFVSAGLGVVILYIGWIQWKQFKATLPEYDDTAESGETFDKEKRFGTNYYEETLAEKRP